MLYYFQPNVILLFIRSNITSEQRVYTLRPKGIFLTTERYIPSYDKLLNFVRALRKVAFNSSRCIALKTVPALR